MAVTNGYTTLADMHNWFDIGPDPDLDPLIELAIEASSRGVDNYTHRHYFNVTAARTFRTCWWVEGERVLLFGEWNDLTTLTSVEDDTGDITADVAEWPANRWKGELWPIRGLVGDFRGLVTVTGEWGWPEVPSPIRNATKLQASRLVKRRKSPEGVVGLNTFGTVKLGQIDPDAKRLTKPYRIRGVG